MYFQTPSTNIPAETALKTLESITKYWQDVNKSIVDVTKNIGQTNASLVNTGSYASVLSNNLAKAAPKLEGMGISAQIASEFLGEMVEHTGTMVGFASEAMVKYGALQNLLGKTNVDTAVKGLHNMGVGLTTSMKMIEEMSQKNQSMGLDTTAVFSQLAPNLKSAAAISFKGGVKTITEMARQATLFGGQMSSVLELADQLRSPEQAIAFTQNMQMLGGELANQFGDVTAIMYEARNEPDKLADRINKATASLYTFNKESGKMELLPENKDKLIAIQKQFNISMDELEQRAQKTKKLEIFKNAFGGMTDDQANILSGFANFKEGGAISLEGLDQETMDKFNLKTEDLADITKLQEGKVLELIETLKDTKTTEQKTAEEQVKDSMTLNQSIAAVSKVIESSSIATNNLTKELSQSGGLKGKFDDFSKTAGEQAKQMSNLYYDGAMKMVDIVEKGMDKIIEKMKKDIETTTSGTSPECPAGYSTCSGPQEPGCTKQSNGAYCKKNNRKGGIVRKGTIVEKGESMGAGGVFNGPSHEEGGIPVMNKTNGKMLEVEGGEAIINKNSTEMFKPLLSKINEAGGGIKFAEGGITPVDIENIMSKMGSMTNTSNVNVGSSSPVNVNVNVNGSISIDGKDFTIPDNEKEKLSKTLIKEVMIKVNSEIGQSTIFTGGRKKATDNTFDY